MKPVVKTINFIHPNGRDHCQIQQFLLDISFEYFDVLHHNSVRWLSGGTALQWFLFLRGEISQFLVWKEHMMPELADIEWLANLAFFFGCHNKALASNITMQWWARFLHTLRRLEPSCNSFLHLFQLCVRPQTVFRRTTSVCKGISHRTSARATLMWFCSYWEWCFWHQQLSLVNLQCFELLDFQKC